MTNPFRLERQFVAPVVAWTCSLFAAGCGGSFSAPGSGASGAAGVSQAGSAQGGGTQGGGTQGGSAQGGSAQGGSAQGGSAQGGGAHGGSAHGGSAQGGTMQGGSGGASAGSCVLDGVTYPDGTGGIPATDGCNVCSCSGGMLRCSLLACPVPKPCGARAGDTCAETEYCAYTPGAVCGAADAEAVCKRVPSSCVATSNAPSVCGCDRKLYLNACVAAQARTGVLQWGSCAGPPL